jgi:hypothetical protein
MCFGSDMRDAGESIVSFSHATQHAMQGLARRSSKRLAGSWSKPRSDCGRDDVKAELCGHYGRVVE